MSTIQSVPDLHRYPWELGDKASSWKFPYTFPGALDTGGQAEPAISWLNEQLKTCTETNEKVVIFAQDTLDASL